MALIYDRPRLYICYFENLEPVWRGPYWTLSPDGVCPGQWFCYEVQTEQLQFERITVPWIHSIHARKL